MKKIIICMIMAVMALLMNNQVVLAVTAENCGDNTEIMGIGSGRFCATDVGKLTDQTVTVTFFGEAVELEGLTKYPNMYNRVQDVAIIVGEGYKSDDPETLGAIVTSFLELWAFNFDIAENSSDAAVDMVYKSLVNNGYTFDLKFNRANNVQTTPFRLIVGEFKYEGIFTGPDDGTGAIAILEGDAHRIGETKDVFNIKWCINKEGDNITIKNLETNVLITPECEG